MKFRRWLPIIVSWLLLVVFFISRAGIFLSSPAKQPESADAMIILGGDAGARSLRGIELYKLGYTTQVILTGLEDGETDIQKYYLHWRSQTIINGGVNKDHIQFDLNSRNSWEEAANTLRLAHSKGWRRVIVISDPPHMRRLQWVWSKVFKDSDIDFVLVAGTPQWWTAERWWSNELSAKFVVNEYLKIAYYLIKY